ncbi:MAG: hypothetical protein Q4D57_01705 [Clostridia bacterium]|nr:hypothetical protein [Clostridia bacterium]
MINLRKSVAMLLMGCMVCQSAQVYALPGIVNPDKYASATQYLEKSRAYFAPLCDANNLLPKLIDVKSTAARLGQTEDAYVTGLILSSFAVFDRSLVSSDCRIRKMSANVYSIAGRIKEEKLGTVEIVAAYRAVINSFKVLTHLKNCSRFVEQGSLDTATSGCINNFLIAIACLYRGGYRNLASFLYDYLSVGGKDEEKLLFDDLRVVNPFKGNCPVSSEVVRSPKGLIVSLNGLNDAYSNFDDSFFVAVMEDEMMLGMALSAQEMKLYKERRAEMEAQALKKEAARAKRIAERAAERADKEAKRKEEEEAIRRKDKEAARLKEQEEEKRKADEKAKRDAEEAKKRAEEEKRKAEHDQSGATEVIDANKTIRESGANMRPAKFRNGKKL